MAADGRSGTLSTVQHNITDNWTDNWIDTYMHDLNCRMKIPTKCTHLVYKFNYFDVDSGEYDSGEYEFGKFNQSISGPNADDLAYCERHDWMSIGQNDDIVERKRFCGRFNFGIENKEIFTDYEVEASINYPKTEFDWTPLPNPGSDLTVFWHTSEEQDINVLGWQIEFKCLTDQIGDDTCENTESEFGSVSWLQDEDAMYSPVFDKQTQIIHSSISSSTNCAVACWNTAGCFRFLYKDDQDCLLTLGDDENDCMEGNHDCSQELERRKRSATEPVGTQGAISPLCGLPPFKTQFKLRSTFYCKFLTSVEEDALIQQIYSDNGISSTTPIGEWIITPPKPSKSQFVKLDTGALGGYPTSTTNEWVWIEFEITTYLRFSADSGRRRRSGDDDLATAISSADDILANLESNIVLPSDVTVAETTELETELVIQGPDGGDAGVCDVDGCTCDAGFESDGDGGCINPDLPIFTSEVTTQAINSPICPNNGWELSQDGTECIPAVNTVSITCNTDSIEVTFNNDHLYKNMDVSHLDALSSSASAGGCAATISTNGEYSLTIPLDSCGTSVIQTSGTLTFSNTITGNIEAVKVDSIVATTRLQLDVECIYSDNFDLISDSIGITEGTHSLSDTSDIGVVSVL